MKILVLPTNISSITTSTVEALNQLPGIEARGIIINRFSHQTLHGENCYFFESVSRKRKPVAWIFLLIKRYFFFRKLVKWADIVHWIYDDVGLKKGEKAFLAQENKPSVVEWVGSDIRNPDILFNLNSYYRKSFYQGYEYSGYESADTSASNQLKFKKYGSVPLVNPEIDLFINKNLFPVRYFIWPRMNMAAYQFKPPAKSRRKPLVLHSPTAKVAKGSNYIVNAVEELKRDFDFDFVLLHGMPRAEVMSYMMNCDVFIDQVILGMYGLATCEAMCFGKPVLCYLMPSVIENGLPHDCPIVNTDAESIKTNLKKLLESSVLRNEIGIQSRAYAELYFDSKVNANKLVEIYNKVIKSHLV